jgi:ATP-binding cassette subfamily B protein/subfamily B ATP-binding cassette protein MsbA
MSTFRRVLAYLARYRGRFAVALALVLVSSAAELARPWPLKITLDFVLGSEAPPPVLAGIERGARLALACAALVLLQLACAALAVWLNRISIEVGQRMVNDLRAQLLTHLQGLSLGFFDQRSTSDLVYRVAFDSFAVQSMLMNGLFPLLSGAVLLIGMSGVLLAMNPPLAAIFFALTPALYLMISAFGRRIERASSLQRERESRFLETAQQGLGSMQLVQAFTAEAREHERMMRASSSALDSSLRLYVLQTTYAGAVNALLAVGSACVLYAGGTLGMSGQISAGDLIVFVTYLTLLLGPINTAAQTMGLMRAAVTGARRVFELLDTAPEIQDPPRPLPLRGVRGALRLDQVSFRYPGGALALRDVSLEIPAGSMLALVGPTGAGKTTLASLIPRFRDPSAGRVLLDGLDLRDLRRHDLRARIGIVPQAPVLFPATLAENIRYGRPEASDADVERAAELAGVAQLARGLLAGYQTRLGPGGQMLSHGQMQRVTIARALLRDPRLLILDEPTSALDAETEAFVMASIEQAMKGRTTLVIAHRLSTVQRADLVAVLEEGRLVEVGRFEELQRAGGTFQRLYEAHRFRAAAAATSPAAEA